MRAKPFALWVIAGGLVYIGLAPLTFVVPLILGAGIMAGGGFVLIFLVFVALFLVAAAFTLKEKRWAYILGTVASVAFVLLFSTNIIDIASNPADSGFWFVMSALPATFLIVLFSIIAFRNAKTGLTHKRYLATPQSTGGLLTVALIGFVIGALVAGAIGAGVILRNLAAGRADIEIVPGAQSAAMAFAPQSFPVSMSIGGTVTWINKDTMSHTVTSNVTGQFDSPLLSTGATYRHTFTSAGRFYYHCTPHPQMWGVIVVS
jgi:plastocyanin